MRETTLRSLLLLFVVQLVGCQGLRTDMQPATTRTASVVQPRLAAPPTTIAIPSAAPTPVASSVAIPSISPSRVPSATLQPTLTSAELAQARCAQRAASLCIPSFDNHYLAVVRQHDPHHTTAEIVTASSDTAYQFARGFAVEVVWSPTADLLFVNEHAGLEHHARIIDAATHTMIEVSDNVWSTRILPWNTDNTLVDSGEWTPGGVHPDIAWSLDGRQVAFLSDSGLCVMNADGSGLRVLVRPNDKTLGVPEGRYLRGFGGVPQWSSDSRYLFILRYLVASTTTTPSSAMPYGQRVRVDITTGEQTLDKSVH